MTKQEEVEEREKAEEGGEGGLYTPGWCPGSQYAFAASWAFTSMEVWRNTTIKHDTPCARSIVKALHHPSNCKLDLANFHQLEQSQAKDPDLEQVLNPTKQYRLRKS